MNVMTRRALLRSTAMIPVGLALADCSALGSLVSAAPAIASDAQLIAQALEAILPTISTLTGLAGGAKNTIANLIATISGVAGQIASAAGTGLINLVQTIGSGVGSIAGLLSGVGNLPAIISQVITDALGLLPAIQSAAGITPAPVAARRFAAMITPDQARSDLQLLLAGRR